MASIYILDSSIINVILRFKQNAQEKPSKQKIIQK